MESAIMIESTCDPFQMSTIVSLFDYIVNVRSSDLQY
jgi:hypothetical protein